MIATSDFTRVNNDINGNPRYVCHFLNLSKDQDTIDFNAKFPGHITSINYLYNKALERAKKIGGKKFHNKQYGLGIVFQSYNLQKLCNLINELNN